MPEELAGRAAASLTAAFYGKVNHWLKTCQPGKLRA